MEEYNSICSSHDKIINLKQSLKTQLQKDNQKKIVGNDDKINLFEEEKVKLQHPEYNTNSLERGKMKA